MQPSACDFGATIWVMGHVLYVSTNSTWPEKGMPAVAIPVATALPGNAGLRTQLSALEQAANGSDGETNKTAETTPGATNPAHAPVALPICGISP